MKAKIQTIKNNFNIHNVSFNKDFLEGLKKSLPIIMGYLPVSFTFGIMASSGGLAPLTASLISMTNFTSAGQFAGTNIIIANGAYLEIAVTTFVINIRYSLMSLSLSQKISDMTLIKKLIIAFGITDETFTVSSFENKPLSFSYMFALSFFPYLSWIIGTFLGATASNLLSAEMQNAMGIALYGMFLALVIPEAKTNKKILAIVIVAITISSSFRYLEILQSISSGWAVIISTVLASTFGAIVFPKED